MDANTIDKLRELGVCIEAVEWAETQADWQAAWDNCRRGDKMLWLLGRLSGPPGSESRKKLVLAYCDCAELTLPYAGDNRKVCEETLRTARAWADGKASIDDVRAAASAAYAAAFAASAASAAYAVAYTAYSASAAAYAASAAVYAAVYVVYAISPADADRDNILLKAADMIRKRYPEAPVL